jgi:hypothetical protein
VLAERRLSFGRRDVQIRRRIRAIIVAPAGSAAPPGAWGGPIGRQRRCALRPALTGAYPPSAAASLMKHNGKGSIPAGIGPVLAGHSDWSAPKSQTRKSGSARGAVEKPSSLLDASSTVAAGCRPLRGGRLSRYYHTAPLMGARLIKEFPRIDTPLFTVRGGNERAPTSSSVR